MGTEEFIKYAVGAVVALAVTIGTMFKLMWSFQKKALKDQREDFEERLLQQSKSHKKVRDDFQGRIDTYFKLAADKDVRNKELEEELGAEKDKRIEDVKGLYTSSSPPPQSPPPA